MEQEPLSWGTTPIALKNKIPKTAQLDCKLWLVTVIATNVQLSPTLLSKIQCPDLVLPSSAVSAEGVICIFVCTSPEETEVPCVYQNLVCKTSLWAEASLTWNFGLAVSWSSSTERCYRSLSLCKHTLCHPRNDKISSPSSQSHKD